MLRVAYHFKAVSFNFCFINFPITLQTCISEDIYQVACIHTKKQYSYGLFWHASPWTVHILEAVTVNAMFWAQVWRFWEPVGLEMKAKALKCGFKRKKWIFVSIQGENREECIWITSLPLLQIFSPTITFSLKENLWQR